MAFVQTASAIDSSRAADGAKGLVRRVLDAIERRRVYNRTVRELAGLSDLDLADLRISRSYINRVALETAYGKNV